MNPNDPISPDSRDELGDRMKMYEHQWCYAGTAELFTHIVWKN